MNPVSYPTTNLPQSFTDAPDPGPSTPGGQQAAYYRDLASQVKAGQIQPGQEGQYLVNAPQVKLPDFNALPQIQSFVPKIQEAGRLKLESGLSALRSQYGKQSEELQSQLAASGTYDSGDKYKLESRMFQERGAQESQLIYNIQAESLAQEVAELQRVGTITEERARLIMDMQFQKAVQEGNWQSAAAIHNADTQMQIKTFNQESLRMAGELQNMGYTNFLKWNEVQIAQAELEIKNRGLDVEEHKVEIAQLDTQLKACALNHGEQTAEVKACVDDAQAEFQAAISSIGEDETGGTFGPKQPGTEGKGAVEVGDLFKDAEVLAPATESRNQELKMRIIELMRGNRTVAPGYILDHRGARYQKVQGGWQRIA